MALVEPKNDPFDRFFSSNQPKTTLDWIVFLANDPPQPQSSQSTVKLDHRTPPTKPIFDFTHLQEAASFLTPIDYERGVLIERNLNDRCGFPICSKKPIDHYSRRKFDRIETIRKRLNRSSTSKSATTSRPNRNQTSMLIDPNGEGDDELDLEEPQFCSQACRDRSDEYLNLIRSSTTPHPFRSGSHSTPTICTSSSRLQQPSSDGQTDDDLSGVRRKSTAVGVNQAPSYDYDLHQVMSSLSSSSPTDRKPKAQERSCPPIDPPLDSSSSSQPLTSSSAITPHTQFNFLEPILNQFQSLNQTSQVGKHNRNRLLLVDQNLNRAFSSIKIVEHPPLASRLSTLSPSSSSSSSPSPVSIPRALNPSDTLHEPDHRFLNFTSPPSTSVDQSGRTVAASTPSLTTTTACHETLDPLDGLSPSFTHSLTSQTILLNSTPGTFRRRQQPQRHHHSPTDSVVKLDDDDDHSPHPPSEPHPIGGLGDPQIEVIYNVGSIEDQLAIDRAMILRDQLHDPPTG